MKNPFRILFPTCKQAARLQSERLDHPLCWSRSLGLGLHLLACRWCRRYGQQICFLKTAAQENPDKFKGQSQAALSPEARKRLKQSLTSK